MKTSRIILIGLLLSGMGTHAQKFYIRAGLGAAVSTAANINYNYAGTSDSNSFTTKSVTTKKAGIGSGLPFVVAAGYKFSDNFSIELGIDYFNGFNLNSKDVYTYSSQESEWHGQMLSIVPAVVMTIHVEKFHPYARLGLKLGVINSVVYKNHDTYTSFYEKATKGETDTKSKDYGGIAIGVQGTVGTDYALTDNISIFGEIQVDGISYSPKHGKYLEYSANGVDQMGNLPERSKKWDYLKDVDFTKNTPQDQPHERPRVNYRFGNVGLILGIKYKI